MLYDVAIAALYPWASMEAVGAQMDEDLGMLKGKGVLWLINLQPF